MMYMMLRTADTSLDLEVKRLCLYQELHRHAATMDVLSLERLCRKIHSIEIKMRSFKGGLYGNRD